MRDAQLAALFERFRKHGDAWALATVFDRTSKELLELACHLVRDPSEAEDLVQATYVTAIQKSARYDGALPLQAWLYGILWREAAKARRRAARRVEPDRLAERLQADPLASAAERELPEAIAEVLAGLPRHYREVLEPLLFEERRPEHIAASLGRSSGTVRSQIHRGLEELRRALAPRFATFGALALPTRGLARLRAEVLEAAGAPAATAALSPAAVLTLTLGGAMATKTMVVATLAVAAVGTGAWVALGPTERQNPTARGAAGAGLTLAAAPSHASVEVDGDDPTGATDPAVERELASVAPAPSTLDERIAHWLARFGERPEDWRHGWSVAEEIAALPSDEALAIMTAVWPHLSVPVKEQVLKPFVFHGGKPNALPLLHLAATDAAVSVQARAFGYLEAYAFQDFALDYEAYLGWAAVNKDRPVAEVLADSARAFVREMLALGPAARAARMLALRTLDLGAGQGAGLDLAAHFREAGGLRVLEAALADPVPEVQELALRWSKTLQADEGWLRAWALPALASPTVEGHSLAYAAFDALARPDCGFAGEAILAYLERATLERLPASRGAGQALGEIGDVSHIPRLIELVLGDTTGELGYDVGYFALAKLTGVTWQKSYDGEWWVEWWEKNRRRFPPEVAAREVRR
jgi:RNA polymerase sigma-70 factor (ECF subfamily)